MTMEEYLDAIEAAHRERGAREFCYCMVGAGASTGVSIVVAGEEGHYPVDKISRQPEAYAEKIVDHLNETRLHIDPDRAALIVASSMRAQRGRR